MNPLSFLFRPFRKQHSCEEINQFLADYLEGSLPEATHSQFQAHLSMCDNCVSFFNQYESTIELVKELDEIKIPEQLVEHTIEFLREKKGQG